MTDENQFKRVDWDDNRPLLSDDDDENGLPVQPPRGPGLSAADLDLLTLAARAIGAVRVEPVEGEQWLNLHFSDGSVVYAWNPLQFSGDALELAVSMHILIDPDGEQYAIATATDKGSGVLVDEPHNGDPLAATRRAVTRAAAEVGKTMQIKTPAAQP